MNGICSTRKTFLAGMASAAAIPVWAGPSPLRLRIGAMSDNHLNAAHPETHRKTKACFELFRRERVDVVLDTGDIADRSDMNELRFFRSCFDAAFAGTETVPFFAVANHDTNYNPATGGRAPKSNDPAVIAAAVAALGMSSPNPCVAVKGYQFVSIRQFEKLEVLEENICKALAANVGNRPVFVMTHEPPYATTSRTIYWSSRQIRNVLNKYPQVVSLSGHIHDSVVWPANVWQGGFTAVNLGAHAQYSNPIDGEATILDVYDDRIDIRRYEAVSGREIGADDRWSIPLPLDPKNGPYRPVVRAAAKTTLRMPSDLGLEFESGGKSGMDALVFRSAEPRNVSMCYRIAFESKVDDGSWRFLSAMNWRRPQEMDERPSWRFEFPVPTLDAGRRHRVTVTPVDSFGRAGTAGTAEFDAPANPLKPLAAEPFAFGSVTEGAKPGGKALVPAPDGWCGPCTNVFAAFPDAALAAVRGRKRVYCVADIGSDQKGAPVAILVCRFPKGGNARAVNIGERIYTEGGFRATNRYVWRIRTDALAEGDRAGVVVTWGDPGRFRFASVRFYA